MRKVMLLASVVAMLVVSASPAVAQSQAQTQVQSQAARAVGAPVPPAYELERDGTLIQGGDVITDCSTFLVAGFEETREGFEDSAQAAENTCERLGYPSGDFTVGNSEIVLSSGADVPGGELPDTGGLPLGGVAAGVGMLLVASGLLVRRRLS